MPTQVAIRLDSPTGDLIGTATIAPTGWYTIFQTTATRLVRPLTGKHTIVLTFTGSSNVYHWQGAVDWIKVASGSAQLDNSAAAAPIQHGTTPGPDNSVTLPTGSSIGWPYLDFDNGAQSFTANVRTTGAATLELRTGSPDGPAAATYALPDTGGTWLSLQRKQRPRAVVGRKDVYLVQTSGAEVSLGTVRWTEGVDPYIATAATTVMSTPEGKSNLVAADSALSVRAGSTIALPPVEFKSGAQTLALQYRSTQPVSFTVRSDTMTSNPIAAGVLPAAPDGKFRTARLPLNPSPTRAHMLFITVDAAVVLKQVQADPVNAAPPQVALQIPDALTTGSEVRIPVTTYDPDGNQVTIKVETLPEGARLDRNVIVWKPRHTGDQSIVLVGDDGHDISRSAVTVSVS